MSTRSLTLAEARRRVTQVESPSYDVHLDLTDPATGTFGSRSTVRFTPRAESTFLELADAAEVASSSTAPRSRRRTTRAGSPWPASRRGWSPR